MGHCFSHHDDHHDDHHVPVHHDVHHEPVHHDVHHEPVHRIFSFFIFKTISTIKNNLKIFCNVFIRNKECSIIFKHVLQCSKSLITPSSFISISPISFPFTLSMRVSHLDKLFSVILYCRKNRVSMSSMNTSRTYIFIRTISTRSTRSHNPFSLFSFN